MESSRATPVKSDYEFNHWLIHQIIDGISHDESMLFPPFETNPLNWLLGHIVGRRQSALQTLGASLGLENDFYKRYGTGSEPWREGDTALDFVDLIELLDRSQAELARILESVDDQRLDQVVENDRGEKPAIEHLQGFHWHETFHLGQLELLKAFIESRR
jgi:hypothetical protein